MMLVIRPPQLTHYSLASQYEWFEADGIGGMAASSAIGTNTRKQHALLSIPDESGRLVLVANLQETLFSASHTYDLSTNAFLGAIHPVGYEGLESFAVEPWPTWRYRYDSILLQKEVLMVHGEHTVLAVYTLAQGDHEVRLMIRPLLAFRRDNILRHETSSLPNSWVATAEFIECRPYDNMPTLFIAHPDARVETLGLWYRGFLYERDQESRVECIEDLYHPGYLELTLHPGLPQALIFSTPSPRSLSNARGYVEAERSRRQAVLWLPELTTDPFFESLLDAAQDFLYERADGFVGIHPGLPFGEAETYRSLLAFSGLLLAPQHLEEARSFISGLEKDWRLAQVPSKFSLETLKGQMHAADVPLWIFIAAWRYWRAAGNDSFTHDFLLPLLQDLVESYISGGEVQCNEDGLLAVGFEPDAAYPPVLPLGTNLLWYNAQMIVGALIHRHNAATAQKWRRRAERTLDALAKLFSCEMRSGLADAVAFETRQKDETVRASQVLAVGLPYHAVSDPESLIRLIDQRLATPYGLRTLAPDDVRYSGDGSDVKFLPKNWSGSVDPTWIGLYHDAFKYIHGIPATPPVFAPIENELRRRGLGHISGAFAGNFPHDPCDCVASASGLGEIMRIYARDVLRLEHVA